MDVFKVLLAVIFALMVMIVLCLLLVFYVVREVLKKNTLVMSEPDREVRTPKKVFVRPSTGEPSTPALVEGPADGGEAAANADGVTYKDAMEDDFKSLDDVDPEVLSAAMERYKGNMPPAEAEKTEEVVA